MLFDRTTMSNDPTQLDAIEKALLELDAAEKAGVFGRTSVDARALLSREASAGPSHPRWLTSRLAMPAAAAVAMAIGVSSWMFTSQLNAPGNGGFGSHVVVADAGRCAGGFFGCLTGPGSSGSTGCQGYDYDSDGDVDLADYGAHQRACAGPSR